MDSAIVTPVGPSLGSIVESLSTGTRRREVAEEVSGAFRNYDCLFDTAVYFLRGTIEVRAERERWEHIGELFDKVKGACPELERFLGNDYTASKVCSSAQNPFEADSFRYMHELAGKLKTLLYAEKENICRDLIAYLDANRREINDFLDNQPFVEKENLKYELSTPTPVATQTTAFTLLRTRTSVTRTHYTGRAGELQALWDDKEQYERYLMLLIQTPSLSEAIRNTGESIERQKALKAFYFIQEVGSFFAGVKEYTSSSLLVKTDVEKSESERNTRLDNLKQKAEEHAAAQKKREGAINELFATTPEEFRRQYKEQLQGEILYIQKKLGLEQDTSSTEPALLKKAREIYRKIVFWNKNQQKETCEPALLKKARDLYEKLYSWQKANEKEPCGDVPLSGRYSVPNFEGFLAKKVSDLLDAAPVFLGATNGGNRFAQVTPSVTNSMQEPFLSIKHMTWIENN